MEPKELLALYRHRFWLLLIGIGIGLAGGFIISKIQTPVYEASAKVLAARSRQQSSTDILSISDQQLVMTYQQLLMTWPVLHEAESRLGVEIDPENVIVEVISNTQIIQIKVQDKNAEQAVAIANMLVQILIEQNEILQAGRYTVYEQGLNTQIAQVQEQITALEGQITQIDQTNVQEQLTLVNQQIMDLEGEISTLEKEISESPQYPTTSERALLTEKQARVDQLRSLLHLYQQIQTNLTFIGRPVQGMGKDDPRITSLQAMLNLYKQLYLNLLNNLETAKLAHAQSTPVVTPIEAAIIPEKPIRPIPWLYTSLSGVIGLLVAAGVILIMDNLDDTLKSANSIQEVLDLPVIGQISEINHGNNTENHSLIDQSNPLLLNDFGSLRFNLNRLLTHRTQRSILITSPALGEGKTTIAFNLAAAFARSGKKTILIDADLYHSTLPPLLGFENQKGLTDILADNLDWQSVEHEFEGISVITSGMPPLASTRLLESEKMNQLLGKLQKAADVIIIDGPPLFVMDAQILASKVGGILVVVRQGNTITSVARAMLDQLKLMEANVLGVTLNRIRRINTSYLNGYYRQSYVEKTKDRMEETKTTQGFAGHQ